MFVNLLNRIIVVTKDFSTIGIERTIRGLIVVKIAVGKAKTFQPKK